MRKNESIGYKNVLGVVRAITADAKLRFIILFGGGRL